MLFNSRLFVLVFLPATLAGFYALSRFGRRAALGWLLLASLFFYAWWKPAMLFLLLASIGVNFGLGRVVARSGWWLGFGVGLNLGLLGFFKYAGLLASSLGVAPPFGGIYLPLGISFFTFQQIMYLVDVRAGDIPPAPFLEYACFIGFFPHLIAGPIVRPSHILPQFSGLRPFAGWQARLAGGAEIFLLGLAKKLVLADGLARFAGPGFAAAARLEPVSLIEAWVALLAYALQIYFDFSGYSDMAIGLARMFGVNFPINFNSPYKATSVSDFWRRWNITLSAFLRDYLYIPLGGNRRGEARRVFNLMATMLLGGLWHGAAWRFLLWGGLHGVYVVIHGWSEYLGVRLPRLMAWAMTLFCVLMAWVPFRAAGFMPAVEFYRGLFGFNGIAIPQIFCHFLPFLLVVGHSVPVLPYLGDARTMSLPQGMLLLAVGWYIALGLPQLHEMSARRRGIALVASFALCVQALLFAPAAIPFLYFQF